MPGKRDMLYNSLLETKSRNHFIKLPLFNAQRSICLLFYLSRDICPLQCQREKVTTTNYVRALWDKTIENKPALPSYQSYLTFQDRIHRGTWEWKQHNCKWAFSLRQMPTAGQLWVTLASESPSFLTSFILSYLGCGGGGGGGGVWVCFYDSRYCLLSATFWFI